MESTKTLQQLVKNVEVFIQKLIQSRVPFALWKSPNSETAVLMVDLMQEGNQPYQENGVWPLEDYENCFVLNSFDKSHPPRPEVIQADLVVQIELQKSTLKIDPKVSSTVLEDFVQKISATDDHAESGNKTDITGSADYEAAVAKAIEEIKSDNLQKVVLSRCKDFDIPEGFETYAFFRQISSKYPNAFCYIASTEKYGLWLGATPERLLTIENNQHFVTDALAGTQPLEDGADLADLAWTQKEIEEQAMVSRYIVDCLKRIRLREFEEIGPRTVRAGNLAHLKTSYSIDMKATNMPNLGGIMLDLLHPTSAVCGFPREKAHQFIHENEGFDRELFAGFLGPVNFEGFSRVFVNLRCMKVVDGKARLFAGAGITRDSKPEKELAETKHKMNTLLSVLRAS
ncbi:MAG: chorismate-binding protein [Cyclobacteriaceae bacterium]